MSAKNRNDLINKLYKVVSREYTPVMPPTNRLVLEHMIYGAVLEDSTFEAADEAYASLVENFYDWNEIRVTTKRQLAELFKPLSKPDQAASRVKKSLHGVFEKYYQYDLEFLKKENLSKAVAAMETFTGVSAFTIAYTAQNGLGGHSIPIDQSFMNLMYAIGAINEKGLLERKLTGLERTIPKSKGVEFSVLVHQLAVSFTSAPFSTNIRNVILKVAPDAKERFPKRGGSKKAEPAKEKAPAKKAAETKAAPKKSAKTAVKAPAKKAKPATKKAKAAIKAPAAKKAKPVAKKAKPVAKKTKASQKAAKKTTKKKATKKAASKKSASKKSASRKLAKKKPR